tara:strand:+ start:237 stop:536 length:300 start_codon:yes stop_codon:yes gene_type:complete
MYETNKGDYIMALEGVLTKEFVYAEFKKCETNADKVKYLKELKETKINHPKIFSMKISVKNIDRLITEWSKPVPFLEVNAEIAARQEKEKEQEKMMRGD